MTKFFLILFIFGLSINPIHAGIDKEFGGKVTGLTPYYNSFFSMLGMKKNYAIVVGVGKYDNKGLFQDLESEKDAMRIKDYLINEAGFNHVHVITEEKVTRERIHQLMTRYSNLLTNQDRFVFYWSGHGVTAGKEGRKVGYLALKNSTDNTATMLKMNNLIAWDDSLEVKQSLYLLDSCFSGMAASSRMSPVYGQNQTLERVAKASRQILTAGKKNESTIGIDDIEGGVFTRAILDGLRGGADKGGEHFPKDGIVTMFELTEYIRDRVNKERLRVRWKSPITPTLYNITENSGDFFFVEDKSKLRTTKLFEDKRPTADGVVVTGINLSCGNGKKDLSEQCDPTDSSHKNWGNKGCDASCKQVRGQSCDQSFYSKLRYGRSYRFGNTYINHREYPVKLKSKIILFKENDGEIDGKKRNITLDWSNEIKKNKFIINPKTEVLSLLANDNNIFNISHYPGGNRNDKNVQLQYQYGTTRIKRGIEKGYFYHTTCINYEITRCGDGVVDNYKERSGRKVSEACDDGNSKSGDGCSSSCAIE